MVMVTRLTHIILLVSSYSLQFAIQFPFAYKRQVAKHAQFWILAFSIAPVMEHN